MTYSASCRHWGFRRKANLLGPVGATSRNGCLQMPVRLGPAAFQIIGGKPMPLHNLDSVLRRTDNSGNFESPFCEIGRSEPDRRLGTAVSLRRWLISHHSSVLDRKTTQD